MAASVYSCGTCRVKFPTLEMMQTHYKCDWHRYNLKRKVAELPPVSAENFADILKAYQNDPSKRGAALANGGVTAGDSQVDKLYCKVCAKSFLNGGSLASHTESKKHLERARDLEPSDTALEGGSSVDPSLVEMTDVISEESAPNPASQHDIDATGAEDDWENEEEEELDDLPPYDVTLCLYCTKKSSSLESNLSHMSSAHSFFIPDFDYCTDPPGLVDYLVLSSNHLYATSVLSRIPIIQERNMAASVYSCGTCRVKFPTLEMMQTHYKCDWHRYNLKRKVAELPPVSAENFADILKAYQNDPSKRGAALANGGVTAGDSQVDKLYCKVCAKSFLNGGSLASHTESKKHLERARDLEPSDTALEGGSSVDPSLVEMTDVISEESAPNPASQHDIDATGAEDDWENEEEEELDDLPPYDVTLCLYCTKKSSSLESNLSHMSSAHSFFIPDFDYCTDPPGLVDYLGKKTTDGHICLYCNQKTFQDTTAVQRHMESKGHCKMAYEGESLLEYEEFYDFTIANESDTAVRVDGEDPGDIDGTGYEMTLPSGATIGHRDLNRYYKQSLGAVKDVALVSRIVGHYKALGWKPNEQGMGYAKNMLGQLNRLKKDNLKKRLHLGMQSNKIMMERYRRQYGF